MSIWSTHVQYVTLLDQFYPKTLMNACETEGHKANMDF